MRGSRKIKQPTLRDQGGPVIQKDHEDKRYYMTDTLKKQEGGGDLFGNRQS